MTEQTIQRKKLIIKRATAGLGLFADEDIPQGSFVLEYTGEYITASEANERGGRYLFQITKNKIIDANGRENLCRYINHSCTPNCEVKIQRQQIFIYALRNIRKGEELGFDYGQEYFDYYIKPKGCKCMHCLAMARLIA